MDLSELYVEQAIYELEIKLRAESGIWIDKQRNEHKISEMETSHIKNCINLINRHAFWLDEYIAAFETELKKRGKNENKRKHKTTI